MNNNAASSFTTDPSNGARTVPDATTVSGPSGGTLSGTAQYDELNQFALLTGAPRPETRVVPLDESLVCAGSGLEVLRVSPSGPPTLRDVINQLELHPILNSPTAFHWVIADTKNTTEESLNHLSVNLMGADFSDVTIASDMGRKKTRWHNNILNCHVSRFDIDPENLLKVKRTAVEVILAPHGLISVDQNGDRMHLLTLRDEIAAGRTTPEVSSSIGALAAKVIEEQLEHNMLVLDALEFQVDELSKLSFSGPLSDKEAHNILPTLEEALAYFLRKTEQTREVLAAIEHSARVNPHFFGSFGPQACLHGTRESLEKLLRHTEAVIEKVNRVEERHDRQMQAKGDKNVERFTFLIGITSPPIMADIACKMLLPHHHHWHPPIAIGSFIVGVGLVAIAVIPEWFRSSRIRMGQPNPKGNKRTSD